MALKSNILKAFSATRSLGIPDAEVKPMLKNLLKLYDGDWKLIEEDNYRTLVDAYFDHKENEGLEGKQSCVIDNDESGRRQKKLCKREHKQDLSTIGGSSHNLTLNEGQIAAEDAGQETTNLIQQSLVIKSSEDLEPISVVYPDSDNNRAFRNGNTECSGSSEYVRPSSTAIVQVSYGNNCSSSSEHVKPLNTALVQDLHARHNVNDPLYHLYDLTKGAEKVKISCINGKGNESLPQFHYIPNNIIFQNANVNISLARISEEECCSNCSEDCLLSSYPCACARETGGEFAYTREGLLKEDFLDACISMRCEPKKEHFFYCQDCPLESLKNVFKPDRCKGHLLRKFIKECWRKCGCHMKCGNRLVQRGISCKLQVFFTCKAKGWGLKTLQNLPKGTFVCEYVGEILTNTELYDRNMQSTGNDRHTYPVTLDADWGSEGVLKDDELLCLDATYYGNVARFINHRCSDANLVDIPVEVETPDRHYYHLAFFTSREVKASEELTWDYGIDFDDENHPVKAFRCCCGSEFCRDKKKKGKLFGSKTN